MDHLVNILTNVWKDVPFDDEEIWNDVLALSDLLGLPAPGSNLAPISDNEVKDIIRHELSRIVQNG